MNVQLGTLGQLLALKGQDLKRPETLPTVRGKSKRKFRHATGGITSSVGWSHDLFGEFMVYVSNFDVVDQHDLGGYYWAEIDLNETTPPALYVRFATNLHPDVVGIFFAQGGEVQDVSGGKLPHMRVPIHWHDHEVHGKVPHTRERDVDNADIVLLLNNGMFMQLQVAVLTRGGKFFLSVQEIWAGEILELEEGLEPGELGSALVGGERYTVSPIWSEQAYPGASYLKTFRKMGPQVLDLATQLEACTIRRVSELPVVEWDPPSYPLKDRDMVGGVVTFFNPIVMGRARLEDGRDVYIRLEAILDEDGPVLKRGFPVLLPRQPVLLRVAEGDRGWYAKSVRPLPMPK